MSDSLSSNQAVDPISGTVTFTAAEFQTLMAEKESHAAEIEEWSRLNLNAVNEREEMARQVYKLTQERDALLKWKARVMKAVGPIEEQPVETNSEQSSFVMCTKCGAKAIGNVGMPPKGIYCFTEGCPGRLGVNGEESLHG